MLVTPIYFISNVQTICMQPVPIFYNVFLQSSRVTYIILLAFHLEIL